MSKIKTKKAKPTLMKKAKPMKPTKLFENIKHEPVLIQLVL